MTTDIFVGQNPKMGGHWPLTDHYFKCGNDIRKYTTVAPVKSQICLVIASGVWVFRVFILLTLSILSSSANQWTGFYMIGTSNMKELMRGSQIVDIVM